MIHPKFLTSLLLVGALALGFTSTPARAQVNAGSGIVINDINLTDIDVVDGVLTAAGTVTGTIAGLPFTTEITDFTVNLIPDDPATPGEECSVLHLALGPINLALLGLHVDTTEICLNVTAIEGGGLLGDLLCGLAGGSDGILGLLTPVQRAGLLADLVDFGVVSNLANQAISQALASPSAQPADETICSGATEVLHLVLGPIDLTLLGLHVHLDDCDNGPVEVCVSATAGEGLLGDLLAGLAGGNLLGNLNLGNLGDLLGSILGVLPTGGVNASNSQVNGLVRDVGRALRDGNLSSNELSGITNAVRKIVRKS